VNDMANMSFALTVKQMQSGEKDVTRRMGWLRLKPQSVVNPVLKCMGLRLGEKITPICGPISVVNTRREPLNRMILEPEYGKAECRREGFPDLTPAEFVDMYCKTHRGCTPQTMVTRIEFTYL